MSMFTRKMGEGIMIGSDIELTFVEVRGKRVRLGLTSPGDLPIRGEEVQRRMDASRLAIDPAAPAVDEIRRAE